MRRIVFVLIMLLTLCGCRTQTWNVDQKDWDDAYRRGFISYDTNFAVRSQIDRRDFDNIYQSPRYTLSQDAQLYKKPLPPVINNQEYFTQTGQYSAVIGGNE